MKFYFNETTYYKDYGDEMNEIFRMKKDVIILQKYLNVLNILH